MTSRTRSPRARLPARDRGDGRAPASPAADGIGQEADELVESEDVRPRHRSPGPRKPDRLDGIRATSSTWTVEADSAHRPHDEDGIAADPAQVVDQDVAAAERQRGRTIAYESPDDRTSASSRALALKYAVGAVSDAFTTLT